MPWYEGPLGKDIVCTAESIDAKAFISNSTFVNFKLNYSSIGLPQCANNTVFSLNKDAADAIPGHNLINTTCTNCSIDSFI